MNTTIELSMYPFQEDYRPLIKSYIDWLNEHAEGLSVKTGPTATLISGPHERVLALLGESTAWSHTTQGRAVFVAKIIPGLALD